MRFESSDPASLRYGATGCRCEPATGGGNLKNSHHFCTTQPFCIRKCTKRQAHFRAKRKPACCLAISALFLGFSEELHY
jgi:hypothetical protein